MKSFKKTFIALLGVAAFNNFVMQNISVMSYVQITGDDKKLDELIEQQAADLGLNEEEQAALLNHKAFNPGTYARKQKELAKRTLIRKAVAEPDEITVEQSLSESLPLAKSDLAGSTEEE